MDALPLQRRSKLINTIEQHPYAPVRLGYGTAKLLHTLHGQTDGRTNCSSLYPPASYQDMAAYSKSNHQLLPRLPIIRPITPRRAARDNNNNRPQRIRTFATGCISQSRGE